MLKLLNTSGKLMTIPLTTSDVIHIAELLREDLEYTKAVIDSSQDMDDILEAQESMEKSRATLMKLGVSTINQIYEPQSMADRRRLN